MTPITIAGETLEDADIPKSPMFRIVRGTPIFTCTAFEVNLTWFPYNDQRSVVAAVARCYFLDKAAEIYRNDPSQGFLTLTEMDAVKKSQSEIARYLDSAEKWARIGRAK